jgi:hypothetical protein
MLHRILARQLTGGCHLGDQFQQEAVVGGRDIILASKADNLAVEGVRLDLATPMIEILPER